MRGRLRATQRLGLGEVVERGNRGKARLEEAGYNLANTVNDGHKTWRSHAEKRLRSVLRKRVCDGSSQWESFQGGGITEHIETTSALMSVTGITLKALRCGRLSVGLGGVLLAFDEALQVGFLAWLHSDRRALSLGDRLPTNHTDGFLTASLLPHKGTPHSFLTPTVADTLHKRGRIVS